MTNEDPPENPESHTTEWDDAILWTVASSLVVGVLRLVAKRGAAALWDTTFDESPKNELEA